MDSWLFWVPLVVAASSAAYLIRRRADWLPDVAVGLRAWAEKLDPTPEMQPFRLTVKEAPPDIAAKYLVTMVTNSHGVLDFYSEPSPQNPCGLRRRHLAPGDGVTVFLDGKYENAVSHAPSVH